MYSTRKAKYSRHLTTTWHRIDILDSPTDPAVDGNGVLEDADLGSFAAAAAAVIEVSNTGANDGEREPTGRGTPIRCGAHVQY